MSEINNKIDLRAAFAATQQTYAEAVEKAKKEAGRPNIDRYRINKDGEYNIRILPLAPNFDNEGNQLPADRGGYEYPLHQLFIKVNVTKQDKKGKSKNSSITIPIIKATDKGVDHSVDLIDKYVDIARSYGDEKVNEQLGKTSFYGGMKWQYQHAMYILDMDDKRKGPKLFQCSHTLYRNIETAKLTVWGKFISKQGYEDIGCPVSGFSAWPITVNRTTGSNNKTESNVNIVPIESDIDELEDKDLQALLDTPRLPELLYRYTRYQFEATLEFLKQKDKELDIDVCAQEDFQEAVETLRGELPADDTSHFDISGEGSGENGGVSDEVTLDSLWTESDALDAEGFEQNSRESKELRDKINQFIQDNNLDVRVSHNKSNADILNDIEDFLATRKGKKQVDSEPEDEPKRKTARKPEPVEDDEQEPAPAPRRKRPEPEDEPENEPEDEPEPAPRRKRAEPEDDEPQTRRRRQPEPENDDNGDGDDQNEPEQQPVRRRRQPEPEDSEDANEPEDDPQPVRRRRR